MKETKLKNKKLKLAVLQSSVDEDKMKNLYHLSEWLDLPELSDVDFVTIGEMFNCPYKTENFPLYAEEEGGKCWTFCSNLAAKHHIYLSAGSMPEKDKEGHVYNTAYVFDREGKQIAKHRKMHLFDIDIKNGQHFLESETLTAGNEVVVFDTEWGKMGLCVCYDFRFPELARLMALKGAKLILVPAAFNMNTGPAHWEIMFRQRAVENQLFTVGTAPARDLNGPYVSYGHSIVVDPWANVLLQFDEKEQYGVVELDFSEIERVREQLPLLHQRREDVYRLSEI